MEAIYKVNFTEKLAIGSIVYRHTFFKEINSNVSFHVPEHCQDDYFIIIISTPWAVCSTQIRCGKSALHRFEKYFFD